MNNRPSSYIEQTIEFRGKRLTLIWDGHELYVQSDYSSRVSVSSLNNHEDSPNGNVTVQFGNW